jgi:RNA polymerase sigma-70 factor (ECF subfamily)
MQIGQRRGHAFLGAPVDAEQLTLVQCAVAGDDDALSRLLEDAGVALRSELASEIGPRYRSLVDADDVLQVTCLEAFLRIRSFDSARAESFFAWLRQIAMNNLRDAIRELEREKRPPPQRRMEMPVSDQSYVELAERFAVTTTTPSRICRGQELRESVDAALRALPPDYEQVLRLYELEGLSGEEVAERMGRRPGAVRMLLARARARLGELLAGNPQLASRA